jgi:hypothetical protein
MQAGYLKDGIQNVTTLLASFLSSGSAIRNTHARFRRLRLFDTSAIYPISHPIPSPSHHHHITITSVHHPQPPPPPPQPTHQENHHTPNQTKPNQNVNIILAHPHPLAHLLHHPLRAVVAGPEQKRSGGGSALGVQEAVPGVVEGVDAGARRR